MKLLSICIAALAVPFAAAQGPAVEQSTFTPSDFAQYAPLNARDMVSRIPGFRLSNSRQQDESRGLGQATENVLINGQRVSSKSSSAADLLARIPASTVEKIELLDGASLDIPGLSGLVVNVVAKPRGVSGTWAYRGRAIVDQKPRLFGAELALSGQTGDLNWNVSLDNNPRRSSGVGTDQLFDATGALLEDQQLASIGGFPSIGGAAGLRWTPPSGLIANLNIDYENFKRERRETASRTSLSGISDWQRIQSINESSTTELSSDMEFDGLNGRIKLIGVYTDRNRPFTNSREVRDQFGATTEDQFFRRIADETELIVRGEYKWSGLGGAWDASLESAVNTLDSTSIFLEGLGGAPLIEVDIGDTTVSVEENRSEGFVTYSRLFGDGVQLQFSLGTEISELSSDGPQSQTRRFTRPKGGATLSWQVNESTKLNARVNRDVGQLDFFDFVSQLDLDDGEDQIGNANIVPEQSWRGELEVERRLGAWGASNILVFAEALEDIVDQVPIGTGEGPGNIDSGSRFGIEVSGTLNFDPIGIDGAQLTYAAVIQDSKIEDPVTGEDRSINGEDLVDIEVELRHDIAGTNFAWGGDFSPQISADSFRLDSIRSERDLPGRMSVFVEHKDLWGLTGRIELFRPFKEIDKRSRLLFSPDRTGALIEIERSRIENQRVLIFGLSGKF